MEPFTQAGNSASRRSSAPLAAGGASGNAAKPRAAPVKNTGQGSLAPRQELHLKPANARRGQRIAICVGVVVCVASLITAGVLVTALPRSGPSPNPTQRISYIGLYQRSTPDSSTSVAAFTAATGVRPDVLTYYSSWLEPFQTRSAATAAHDGAVPLVEIDPQNVSLAAIASGQYDNYLTSYARAVRAYGHQVILSFGHEMNGNWYSWAYTHASPVAFVDAWRHIVTLFRGLAVRNVKWLWTVNVIDIAGGIPPPAKWWPGGSYVTWVGVDGYYYEPSWTFASLFGPTIAAVRTFTPDPILITETGAPQGQNQPSKIANLFAGIRLYGLLGFVWFDVRADRDWRLLSPAAFAAFHQGAETYHRPSS